MGFLDAILGRTAPGKYAAALNALTACHMYSMFTSKELAIINDKLATILVGGGISISQLPQTLQRMTEAQFFCFVSQAFMSIGIPPVFPKEFPRSNWNILSNPFVALSGAEDELLLAKRVLLKNYGVSVEVSNTKQAEIPDSDPGSKAVIYTDEDDMFNSETLKMHYTNFKEYMFDFISDWLPDSETTGAVNIKNNELDIFIAAIPMIQFACIWKKQDSDTGVQDRFDAYSKWIAYEIIRYENYTEREMDIFIKNAIVPRVLEYEPLYINYMNTTNSDGLICAFGKNVFDTYEWYLIHHKTQEALDVKHKQFMQLYSAL